MFAFLKSPLFLRVYRAALVIAIVLVIHQQARWLDGQRGASISLKQARRFFPTANRVQLRDVQGGWHFVTDARGEIIGCLLTTSPHTDHILGYSGPNNLLVAVDSRGAIAGLDILRSGDTEEHVQRVRHDPGFLRSFIGWKPSEAPLPKITGVSGATLTSLAMAESIQQRLAGATPSLRFPAAVHLDEVRIIFTNAHQIVRDGSRLRVLDISGQVIGFALRTSPQADNIAGYRGPTECLVGLAPDGRTVTRVHIRKSYDTDSYVDQIRKAETFLNLFVGRTFEELASADYSKHKIEGVSGATQTARGVSEGLKARFAAERNLQSPPRKWSPKPRDWALAGVVVGACVLSFTSLRGHRWIRFLWQVLLVAYVGLINHDLLSLALLGGWAANGLALKAAPALVLLTAAALLVPLGTRRHLYCHQICPHGAAQELLGKLGKTLSWGRMPPAKLSDVLECIPGILLAVAVFALVGGWQLNLAKIEPFDAWAWRTAGTATVVIAAAGLAASLFIPQAYCRFGCPTGALLNFIRSSGAADRWGRRDWGGLGFLAAAIIIAGAIRARPTVEHPPEPLALRGPTMGTTWSVKIQDEVAEPAALETRLAAELEWAEAMTSHWRTNTDISKFNRTPTTNAMPVPWPIVTLSRWSAELSRASSGAFDITVGPLVRLWGFGPGPRRASPPAAKEIADVRPAVGWEKLEVLDGMLRKSHPNLQVDLSSIAEGWAVDQLAQLLEYRGYTNFLVEVGGELRARGRWIIAIEHPTRIATILNESLSTSGTYRQNYQSGGRRFSHLIDPRTGHPVTHRTVSVSVRHPDCALADAWSTALNVLGADAGLPLADALKLSAQFVVERSEGQLEVLQSTGWKARQALAE